MQNLTRPVFSLDSQEKLLTRQAYKHMSERMMEPYDQLIVNAKTQFYQAYVNGVHRRAAYLAIWHPFEKLGPVFMCCYSLLDENIVHVYSSHQIN
jgi:hypothetical protein